MKDQKEWWRIKKEIAANLIFHSQSTWMESFCWTEAFVFNKLWCVCLSLSDVTAASIKLQSWVLCLDGAWSTDDLWKATLQPTHYRWTVELAFQPEIDFLLVFPVHIYWDAILSSITVHSVLKALDATCCQAIISCSNQNASNVAKSSIYGLQSSLSSW